jgi:micrococcal nuclease
VRFGATGPSLGAVLLLAGLIALLVFGGSDETEDADRDAGGGRGTAIRAPVLDVIDGDTIEVSLGGEEEDVRYIGVDTPESVTPGEPVECYGERASAFNASLVEGEEVRLVFDAERRDDYGRLLAYVYVGETFVNAELVERGLATTLEIEPNITKAPLLERLERAAGREGRGLWAACPP